MKNSICKNFLIIIVLFSLIMSSISVFAVEQLNTEDNKTAEQEKLLNDVEKLRDLQMNIQAEEVPEAFWTNRFIVKFKDNNNDQGKDKISGSLKDMVKSYKKTKKKNIEVIYTTKKLNPKKVIDKISLNEEIEFIQPDYKLSLASEDMYFGEQWGLFNQYPIYMETEPVNQEIDEENNDLKNNEAKPVLQGDKLHGFDANVVPAWGESTGQGAVVALLDTGIDVSHYDLENNIWKNKGEIAGNGIDDDGNGYVDDVNGWNFTDNSNKVQNVSKNEWHGTHIAGIIGSEKDNETEIAGISPGAKIMPLKVFADGEAYTSDIIDAIEYASQMGAQIANCSWSSAFENNALKGVMRESNLIFVAAAGNNGWDIDKQSVFPASFDLDNIITVASINDEGFLSAFSNYGQASVDIAAPGENIISTIPGNDVGFKDGTSMAAAFVSGEIALLLGQNSQLSKDEIRSKILNFSDKMSSLIGKTYNSSKINVENAVKGIVNDEVIDINGSTGIINTTETYSTEPEVQIFTESTVGYESKQISAGMNHSLLLQDGIVWSWGGNEYGQLGDGTKQNKTVPVQVSGLNNITAVYACLHHSIALKSDGTVWTWGFNSYGQLGDGTITSRNTPVQVSGLTNVIAILLRFKYQD
ncbi:S8 family peptidase [Dehalobacterium formicoaceticum]|uniref:S8 family serine peptidase n=1 Tax=Dehalobacterium formicoaceticum TaxID=51515 RepID=A0ABT1Y5S0_9FIRM|nr:S8 family peptidase [Dehalobacterium formicoaceticum]MCR6546230.1 S8 family serine peptidase [Dehalobacterium formicoaceticum]